MPKKLGIATGKPRVRGTTDMANAQRLKDIAFEELAYVEERKSWFAWDGKVWAKDNTAASRWAMKLPDVIRAEANALVEAASSLSDGKEQERWEKEAAGLFKWAHDTSMRTVRQRALSDFASLEDVTVPLTVFDADPWLLNCQNGILDLRTGNLMPHSHPDAPGKLCAKILPVSYVEGARSPVFNAFLSRVMPDKTERFALARLFGYALTGSTREQFMALLVGKGANGKSTLVETFQAILGPYAVRLPSAALLQNNFDKIPNDIARLAGARFIVSSEFPNHGKMNESSVKELTGGDTVSARFMQGEWFDFTMRGLICVSTNYMPGVSGTDDGIWRRLQPVPFRVQIPKAEQDGDLKEKMAEEAEGILAWAVRGCLSWQEKGMRIPASWKTAADEYREESDWIGQFISEYMEVEPGSRELASVAYDTYLIWARDSGIKNILSKIMFGKELKSRGFSTKKSNSVMYWEGICRKRPAGKNHLVSVK